MPSSPSHQRNDDVDRVAQALNDDWAAGIHGGHWETLDESERARWREAALVAMRALVVAAQGDDEWVSGHDLCVRIGAIVTESVR